MCFTDDLVKYDMKGSLFFYPVVSLINKDDWKYGSGHITHDMISDYMPSSKGII
jgi:hypothetical protein